MSSHKGKIGAACAGLALGILGTLFGRRAKSLAPTFGRDWDEMLKAQRHAIDDLLFRFREANAPRSRDLAGELKTAYDRHLQAEENTVYPMIAETFGGDEAATLYADHAAIKQILRSVLNSKALSAELIQRVKTLRTIMSDHTVREEIVLGELKDQLSDQANSDLTELLRREITSRR